MTTTAGRRRAFVAAALAWILACACACAASRPSPQQQANALLDQALLAYDATAVVRLATVHRDPRAATFVRRLLDPMVTRDIEPEWINRLAGAAEVLGDTRSVPYLWRRVLRTGPTPRIERAILALACPEHVRLIGYSIDDEDYRIARLSDAVLRRVGPLDVERNAKSYVRNAIAVRNAWLESRRRGEEAGYAETFRIRSLLRRHIQTAGLLGEQAVVPNLRGMLSGGTVSEQREAARALARLNEPSWRTWSLDTLHAPNERVTPIDRVTAAELLASTGDPAARDLLTAWLYKGDEALLIESLCALVRVADPGAIPALEAWLDQAEQSPHRHLGNLALAVSQPRPDSERVAAARQALPILLRYDVDREPPIRPRWVLAEIEKRKTTEDALRGQSPARLSRQSDPGE